MAGIGLEEYIPVFVVGAIFFICLFAYNAKDKIAKCINKKPKTER